jgi:predicted secreted protein
LSEHRLGSQDAGRPIDVAAGDRLVVGLSEMPGAGYTWATEALPPGARVVDERFEQAAGAGIGGSSEHIFEIDPGDGGSLRLRLWRPWLGDAGVSERYELTVRVSDATAPAR